MDPRDVEIVNGSFASIFSQKAALADHFYKHLFIELPHVQPLFGGELAKQKEMFSIMLAAAVRSISDERDLGKLCEGLKSSHAAYGLGSMEAAKASKSLMQAFKDVLGSEFDKELEGAWERTIARLIQAMV
ncbi:globin domain-containing protein [Leisingera sp. ANG59]|uniref:globin domain-containing protein n=1 Tax=Leisingera sp. ANG59 TaxID=2675221 RepID=UPI0015727BA3|nr:globin domain protein [Leisingera sp. ANG59]